MANEDNNNDITISKPVIELATVANEFCYFLDNLEKKEKETVLDFMQRILPLMYLKGSLIPIVEPEYPEANERFVTEEQWERVFNELREILGKDDEYWVIDPQYINETEPLKASLSENIADIYQDMKDFISLLQKNTVAARENAVSQIRQLHAEHWGYRVGNIFTRVHHLIYYDEEIVSPF